MIAALFFSCVAICINASSNFMFYRFNVEEQSHWDVYEVNLQTMKGSAVACQPTFCVSWNDMNGFAASFGLNQTANTNSLDSIALSSDNEDQHCWMGQCIGFKVESHSVFIRIEYADHSNDGRNDLSLSLPKRSVMNRRRLPVEETEEYECKPLPEKKPGTFARMKSSMKSSTSAVASGAASAIARMRSKSTHVRSRSASEEEEEEKPAKKPVMSKDGTCLVSKKDAKAILEELWLEEMKRDGVAFATGDVEWPQFEEWKTRVFATAVSVFAKEKGEYVECAADVLIGILTADHNSLIRVARKVATKKLKSKATERVGTESGASDKGSLWVKQSKAWAASRPTAIKYWIRNGHSDTAAVEKRKKKIADDYLREKVSVHVGIGKHAKTTAISAVKSGAATIGAAFVIGAVIGGPLFPVTALASAGLAAGTIAAKGVAKGVYIKLREKEKMRKLGANFEEFFAEFANELGEITFGHSRIRFKDLDPVEKIRLCFLLYLKMKEFEQPEFDVELELDDETSDYIPFQSYLHRDGESDTTELLSASKAGTAEYVVKDPTESDAWFPIDPPDGYAKATKAQEDAFAALIADRTPMSSAATDTTSGGDKEKKKAARSQYHNEYNGYNRRYRVKEDVNGEYRENDHYRYESKVDSSRAHGYQYDPHYSHARASSSESYWNGLMVGGLFGGTAIVFIILVFCIGFAFGMVAWWAYMQQRALEKGKKKEDYVKVNEDEDCSL